MAISWACLVFLLTNNLPDQLNGYSQATKYAKDTVILLANQQKCFISKLT